MKTETENKWAYWVFDSLESLDGGSGLGTDYYGPYPYTPTGLKKAIKIAKDLSRDGNAPPTNEARRRVQVMVGNAIKEDGGEGPGFAENYDHKPNCKGTGPCSCPCLPEF
jgi:hypothetical protein